MKILMLNHEFPPVGGGASPVTFELCTHLAMLGHSVDVVTMHYKNTSKYEQVNGFTVYRTPALRARPNICYPYELATYVPGAFFKTLKLCRKNKYDIIHCHFLVPGAPLAYLISKITKIPFIVTCHGSDVPGYNPDRFGLLHKLIMPVWKFLVKKPSLITSPSQSLKDLILSHCRELNIRVVPNGLETSTFNPAEKEKRILMCSRLLPRKGFQYALQAMQYIEGDWQVDIIGEGPFRSELEKEAKQVKMPVKFHGWIDRKDAKFFDLFNRSSIFVFPSKAESFGVVVCEAMAASCAVIASDIPAHREVLGDAGLFVPPENAEAIKKHLTTLMENEQLRRQLQAKATNRAKIFDWSIVAQKYVEAYKEVVLQK
jgi:glycosyltransferase involved in cell wall biosynthesis